MRIGTWNLNVRWTEAHRALVVRERCDVWLLTELIPKALDANARMADYHCHWSRGMMSRRQHWAAVLSLVPLTPLPDPHEASAAALVDGVVYCSSILPWASCARQAPSTWTGATLEDMVRPAIERLVEILPKSNVVWGGDWNQNLAGGSQRVGSRGMRSLIEGAVKVLGLRVPTAELPHQIAGGPYSIDHIAVPLQWKVCDAVRIPAKGLSDHDAYVVDVDKG